MHRQGHTGHVESSSTPTEKPQFISKAIKIKCIGILKKLLLLVAGVPLAVGTSFVCRSAASWWVCAEAKPTMLLAELELAD